ncbi:MAG TPA: AIR carboxylase family protein, partial [Lacipirellulaceae bacterium]|nr:AIR carboxylase family protein [Lacipirellulaceae bacterium]
MGSKNDWEVMQAAGKILDEFGVAYEAKVASAHRSPALVADFAKSAESRGLEVVIAAAGLAAHLAGVVASMTLLPVLGVPMHGNAVGGLDALLA